MIRPLTYTATTPNAQAAANADPSKCETSIYVHLPGVIGMGPALGAMSYFSSLFFKSQGPSPNKGMKGRWIPGELKNRLMQIITEHSHVQWGVGLSISSGQWRDATVKKKKGQTRIPTTTGKLVIPASPKLQCQRM